MVAVELWIIHATSIPRRKPMTGLFVTLARAFFIAPPEELFRPSPMTLIPYRNMERPPRKAIKL
jgi:hypothetical protein